MTRLNLVLPLSTYLSSKVETLQFPNVSVQKHIYSLFLALVICGSTWFLICFASLFKVCTYRPCRNSIFIHELSKLHFRSSWKFSLSINVTFSIFIIHFSGNKSIPTKLQNDIKHQFGEKKLCSSWISNFYTNLVLYMNARVIYSFISFFSHAFCLSFYTTTNSNFYIILLLFNFMYIFFI